MPDEDALSIAQWIEAAQRAYNARDYAAADRALRAGLDLAVADGDIKVQADLLARLGSVQAEIDPMAASPLFERACALFQQIQDPAGIGLCYGNLAMLSANPRQQRIHARRAVLRSKEARLWGRVASGFSLMSQALDTLNRRDRANLHSLLAVRYHQRSGNRVQAGHCLCMVAARCAGAEQYESSIARYEQALALFEQENDLRGILACLRGLGIGFMQRSELSRALHAYDRAIEIAGAIGDPIEQITLLNRMGRLQMEMAQDDLAAASLQHALLLAQHHQRPADAATSQTNLADLYFKQDRYTEALDAQLQAAEGFRQAEQLPDYAGCLQSAAVTLKMLGRFDEALVQGERAERIFGLEGDTRRQGLTWLTLGRIYVRMGRHQEGLELIARSEAAVGELGHQELLSVNQAALGFAHAWRGDFGQAIAECRQALQSAEALQDPYGIGVRLWDLAIVLSLNDQLDEAIDACGRALEIFETISLNIGAPDEVGRFQEGHLPNAYPWLVGLLHRRGRVAEALEWAERGRARGLARQVGESRELLARTLPQAEIDRLVACREEMDAAYLALSSLTSGSALSNLVTAPQAEERRKAEDRYHIAQRKINILRAELYARHPSFRRLQGADAPSLSQFQALAARNPDTLYLEWVTDDASTLLFAVSHETGLQGFNLPKGRSELADGVDRWRATLEAQSERDPARRRAAADLAKREPDEAQALYRVLLGELEEAGLLEPQRFARLVIVPDGPLLTLPFAALCSPSGHRLIDRYALSVSISLGILCWPESDIKPTGSLLCIAASDGESQVSSRWGYFPPLAAVQQEIDAIRGLFPDACVLQGDEAVKPRIRQEIGRYAVLHFTTHGWLSPADPMSSGLLLPRAPAVSEEEGVLEAREILGQPLAARMAVLSACHSGQGHERGGEGLLGLVWAFHAAGCPAVVAAQWSANDGATAALMERLYTELRRGLRKDEAMRAAMRHLRDQAGPAYPLAWKLPYFWATFQVNGNTASLDVNGQAEVQSYPVPLRRQT